MIGVGVNPAAPDFEREIKRFAWKVEAGAEWAITQPVFDLAQLECFLKRVESFMASKLSTALATRRERAERLLELDEAVAAAVAGLKSRGFESPYLKAFVLARLAAYKHPRRVIVVTALPRTHLGKVDRGKLRAQAQG